MESITKFVSSWSGSQESAANITFVVVGNPHVIAGLLLSYLLLGVIIVITAFCTQRSKLTVFKERIIIFCKHRPSSINDVQNLQGSVFTILVLMDIVNGVTAIVLAVYFILLTCGSACNVVSIVLVLSKSFGIVLHLLCALLSVLHLCHPHWRVQLRICTAIVLALTAVFTPFNHIFPLVGLIGLAVVTFGLALAIIAKSFGSIASPSAAASKRWIVFVAMFTFLVIYLPAFVLNCLRFSYPDNSDYLVMYVNLVYGTNFQLALDGFLCLLILGLSAEVEEEQQPPPYSIQIPPVHTIQNPDFK